MEGGIKSRKEKHPRSWSSPSFTSPELDPILRKGSTIRNGIATTHRQWGTGCNLATANSALETFSVKAGFVPEIGFRGGKWCDRVCSFVLLFSILLYVYNISVHLYTYDFK